MDYHEDDAELFGDSDDINPPWLGFVIAGLALMLLAVVII